MMIVPCELKLGFNAYQISVINFVNVSVSIITKSLQLNNDYGRF